MSKQAVENGTRLNAFAVDPDDLIVPPKGHPLYDPRSEDPIEERLVLAAMRLGIFTPALVVKVIENEETKLYVVDGRDRVRTAREANKRLRESGAPDDKLIRVPVMVRRGKPEELFGITIAANELRRADTPIRQAKKIQKFLDFGHSEEEAALVFGVSKPTLKRRLELLSLSPEEQTKLERGERTQQDATTPAAQRTKEKGKASAISVAKRLAKREPKIHEAALAVLRWVSGEITAGAAYELVPGLEAEVKAIEEEKRARDKKRAERAAKKKDE